MVNIVRRLDWRTQLLNMQPPLSMVAFWETNVSLRAVAKSSPSLPDLPTWSYCSFPHQRVSVSFALPARELRPGSEDSLTLLLHRRESIYTSRCSLGKF